MFGYDTAVISGTIGLVKTQFALDTALEGWFVSSALVGCILGVAIAGELSDRFGRKKSLIATGFLFSLSAIGCGLCGSTAELIIYRLIGGIGVGIASMLSPLYISEVSPAAMRGRMVALYQFAITAGILCAYFSNALVLNLSESLSLQGLWQKVFVAELWRGMFMTEVIPALAFLAATLLIPESPRWYAATRQFDKARKVLSRIDGGAKADEALEKIRTAIAREDEGNWGVLFHRGIRTALLVGMALSVLSQFTGINAIIYYGPRILESANLALSDALGSQVVIGLVNVLSTIYAVLTIDRYGRKKLMQGGVLGMFVSLLMVTLLFLLEKTQGLLLLTFILTFIASFAIGYGPVIWTLLAEIYPTKVRGRAMSVATLTLWTATAIIGQVVPWMLKTLSPAGTFLVFALFCIPVPLILRFIPEPKGLSLEEIETMLVQNENG